MKENNSKKLKYRIIEASSEDPEYPVFELLKGMESNGWVSSRFCNYPQEILILSIVTVCISRSLFKGTISINSTFSTKYRLFRLIFMVNRLMSQKWNF